MKLSQRVADLSNASAIVALGRVGSMAMSLVGAPIVARGLGPDGRGTSAAVLAVLGVAPVLFGLGIPLAARRRIASGRHQRDVVTTARAIALTMAPPALALAWIVEVLAFPGLSSAERVAYYVSMGCVPLSISWATDVSVMIVSRHFRRIAILGLLNSATALAVTLAVWTFSTLTVESIIYASLGSNVVTFLVSALWVPARGGRPVDFRETFSEGFSLAGGQLAEIASKRVDQVIALPLMGAAAAGLYSVAVTVGLLLIPIGQALGAATFAALTSDPSRQIRVHLLRYSVALSGFGGLCLAVASWFGIPIIFGEDYSAARPAAIAAVIGTAFVCIGLQASLILTIERKGLALSATQLTGAILGLGAFIPCGATWGPTGAAWASAAGSVLATGAMLATLRISPLSIIPRFGDLAEALRLLFRPAR